MKVSRVVRGAIALALLLGLVPMGAAQAAVNKPPRIKKAELKDKDADGLADRIVLTYNERINHKLDTARFPFRVDGYKILKVNGARRSLRLTIILKESQSAPLKPAFVKYSRTRQQPVVDLKKKQASKQLLNRNIIGLTAPPPPPEGEFTLTVSKGGDGLGTVTDNSSKINCGTACSASYPEGTQVTLTATPDAASKATFGSWTGCTSTTSTCTVTMDADKSVTATFAKAGTFLLTVAKAGPGTGTVMSTSAPTQPSQINCGATCTASYPKDAVVTLSASADQASQSLFGGWSGGGCTGASLTCNVTMDAAKTVTATFNKAGQFLLTVTKNGNGTVSSTSAPTQPSQINCGSTCTATYPAGTQVTLTASPDTASGATFSGWSGGGCTGSSTTCTVTMDADKPVTATFSAATQRTLTVTPSGPSGSGTVTSTSSPTQPDQINCGSDCTANYPTGTTVTLNAQPASGFKFDGWSGDATCGSTATCQLTMDAVKNVTATFASLTVVRNLSVAVTGGTAHCVSAAAGVMTTCNGGYDDGDTVTITLTPSDPLAPLATWGGDCAGIGVLLTCQLTMSADRVVTATFGAAQVAETGTSGGLDVGLGLPLP